MILYSNVAVYLGWIGPVVSLMFEEANPLEKQKTIRLRVKIDRQRLVPFLLLSMYLEPPVKERGVLSASE